MRENISIREFLLKFENGEFNEKDRNTQINAGWYDWFCKDSSLRNKTYVLVKRLKGLIKSKKIDIDKMYVFFKNNCPMCGKLYDDFRICDMDGGGVIYTITPSVGYDSQNGEAEVWGKENDFKEPIVSGTWKDVKNFFGV